MEKKCKIKAWCTCKVVVLLIKPVVLLKFSLPSCRWIFVVITWTRMLDGKANGCSQWFLSHRSVASGLEKPPLAGYLSPCIYMVLISHLFFLEVKICHLQRKKSAARRTSSLENGRNHRGPERAFRIMFRDKAFVNYHLLSDPQILIWASCQAPTGR